jgi:hypothetical protein
VFFSKFSFVYLLAGFVSVAIKAHYDMGEEKLWAVPGVDHDNDSMFNSECGSRRYQLKKPSLEGSLGDPLTQRVRLGDHCFKPFHKHTRFCAR